MKEKKENNAVKDKMDSKNPHRRRPKMLSGTGPDQRGGWIRSAGFLFFAFTVVPILVGVHIGSYFGHETTGALAGVIVGVALAIWIVIRPLWRDADVMNDQKKEP